MTPTPRTPSAPGASELAAHRRFGSSPETFWRGISSTHGLGPGHRRRAERVQHARRSRAGLGLAPRPAGARAVARRLLRSGLRRRPTAVSLSAIRTTRRPSASGWNGRRFLGTSRGRTHPRHAAARLAPGPRHARGRRRRSERAGRPAATGSRERTRAAAVGRHRERPAPRGHAATSGGCSRTRSTRCVDLVDRHRHALRVVQMNDAFAMRLGRPRADLLERPLAELVGAELADWAASRLAKAGSVDPGAERAHARSSTQRLGGSFVVTMTPLINEDGEPVGTVLVARDITRADAARSETRRRSARSLAQSEKLAVARPVRRRHRPRDQQPTAGRARTSRVADGRADRTRRRRRRRAAASASRT